MASLTIVGPYKEWFEIASLCDKSFQDEAGIGVGILNRTISTDLGKYRISYILLYLDKAISHRIRRSNIIHLDQIKKEGLEEVLHKIGKKTIINILHKSSKIEQV